MRAQYRQRVRDECRQCVVVTARVAAVFRDLCFMSDDHVAHERGVEFTTGKLREAVVLTISFGRRLRACLYLQRFRHVHGSLQRSGMILAHHFAELAHVRVFGALRRQLPETHLGHVSLDRLLEEGWLITLADGRKRKSDGGHTADDCGNRAFSGHRILLSVTPLTEQNACPGPPAH
jgi:hypothetical protein